MKAKIFSIDGNVKGEIELPKCFDSKIREDIIKRAFMTFDKRQPYGSFPRAGHSVASGVFSHRRRANKGAYGIGISRIPRKIMSHRGSRFTRVGATMPGTRGGRQAHPPKSAKVWVGKMNKKEKMAALRGLIASTTSLEMLKEYYPKINFGNMALPIIVEEKITEIGKTKQLKETLGKLLGNAKALARKGGVLIVAGKEPKISHSLVDFAKADSINVFDLAPSGKPGRLVIYTDGAIEKLRSK